MKKLNFKIIALVIAGMTSGVNASEIPLSDGFGSVNFFEATTPLEKTTHVCAAWVNHQIELLQQTGDRRKVATEFGENLGDLSFYSIDHFLSEYEINEPIENKHQYVRQELERVNVIMGLLGLTAPHFDLGLVDILFPRPVAVAGVISTSVLDVASENAVGEIDTPLQADIRAKIIKNIALVEEAFDRDGASSDEVRDMMDALSGEKEISEIYSTSESAKEFLFALECYYLNSVRTLILNNKRGPLDLVRLKNGMDHIVGFLQSKPYTNECIVDFQVKKNTLSLYMDLFSRFVKGDDVVGAVELYMKRINGLFPEMPAWFLMDATPEKAKEFLDNIPE